MSNVSWDYVFALALFHSCNFLLYFPAAKFSHIFLTNATFRQEAQKMIEKYKADAFFRKSFEKQIDSNTLVFNGDKVTLRSYIY